MSVLILRLEHPREVFEAQFTVENFWSARSNAAVFFDTIDNRPYVLVTGFDAKESQSSRVAVVSIFERRVVGFLPIAATAYFSMPIGVGKNVFIATNGKGIHVY